MSAPIGPGDWVECVDDAPGQLDSSRLLSLGGLYRVDDIRIDANGCTSSRCRETLFSVFVSGDRKSWCGHRFRPIYRPKSSIIEALKAPVSLPEEVAVTRPAPAERLPREPLRAEG